MIAASDKLGCQIEALSQIRHIGTAYGSIPSASASRGLFWVGAYQQSPLCLDRHGRKWAVLDWTDGARRVTDLHLQDAQPFASMHGIASGKHWQQRTVGKGPAALFFGCTPWSNGLCPGSVEYVCELKT